MLFAMYAAFASSPLLTPRRTTGTFIQTKNESAAIRAAVHNVASTILSIETKMLSPVMALADLLILGQHAVQIHARCNENQYRASMLVESINDKGLRNQSEAPATRVTNVLV